jgi:hypothetical protein
MKRALSSGLIAIATATAGALSSTIAVNARAQSCSWGATGPAEDGHWYAELQQDSIESVADRAAEVAIFTNNLTTDSSNDFVDHEMWYGTVDDCSDNVEVGLSAGSGASNSGQVFWAESDPSGYFPHFMNSAPFSLNAWEIAQVYWSGTSCEWTAFWYDAGTGTNTNLGTSMSNCGGSTRCFESGVEADPANDNMHVGGYMADWYGEDNNNNWTFLNPGFQIYCPADIVFTNSSDIETEEGLHGPF